MMSIIKSQSPKTTYYEKFWAFATRLLSNSLVGRVVLWCISFFTEMSSQSFIFNMFNRGYTDEFSRGSVISARAGKTVGKVMSWVYSVINKSRIIRFAENLFNRLCSMPLRVITALFSSAGIAAGIAGFAAKNIAFGVAGLAVAAVGFIFNTDKVRIFDIFNSSKAVKWIFNLVGLEMNEDKLYETNNKASIIFSAVYGAVSGVCFVWFPLAGLLMFAGIIGIHFIFCANPVFYICMLMFTSAFLPTVLNAGIMALMIVNFLIARAYGKIPEKKFNFIEIITVLFIAFLAYGSIMSVTPKNSIIVGAMWFVLMISVFIIRRSVNNKKDLYKILTCFVFAALLTGFFGLYQYLSGNVNTTWTDTQLFEELKLRVYSTFENPNVFGEYLLLVIPVSIALFINKKGIKNKAVNAGIILVLIANLFLTYSRGCYIGLAAGIVIFIWLVDMRLLGIGIFAAIPALFLMPSSIISRITSITNLADSSTSYRVSIWRGTLRMLKDYAFTGVGIGEEAYNAVYPKYALSSIIAPHSHNLFLQIMCSVGVIGLIVFLIMIFSYIRNGVSVTHRTEDVPSKIMFATFVSAMVSFMIQSVFDYTWYNYRIFMVFWIFVGLGNAVFEIFSKKQEEC